MFTPPPRKGTRRVEFSLGRAELTMNMEPLQFRGHGISYGMMVYVDLRVSYQADVFRTTRQIR